MMLMPADTFTVISNTVLNDNDRKILTMLYQPVCGHLSIGLYFTLWSELDINEVMSRNYTHHHLMNLLNVDINTFKIAREKLEALGLLKVYFKEEEINDYIYELYSPLSACEFLNHPILNVTLFDILGKKEYERIVSYFELPSFNKKNYKNITLGFNDVFKTVKYEEPRNILAKDFNKGNINVEAEFDVDFLIGLMPKGLVTNHTFTPSSKKLIKSLSFLYSFDAMTMKDLIVSSLDESGRINDVELRKASKNYYKFDNSGTMPKLVHRKEKILENNSSLTNYEKMVRLFETTSPYQFLKLKYKGTTPTQRDIKLIEELMLDQQLNPGVVNVLIDYVLKINNKKLSKNFVETIAGQWKRLDIKDVKTAMQVAEEEYNNSKIRNEKTGYKKKEEKLPEWFDKDIKEEKMSKEEEDELREILGKYGE